MTKEDVIKKIIKMRRRAEGSSYEGERLVCRRMISRLMAQHGITEYELDIEATIGTLQVCSTHHVPDWEEYLTISLGRLYKLPMYQGIKDDNVRFIALVGTKKALSEFQFVYDQIKEYTLDDGLCVYYRMSQFSPLDKQSFMVGFADGCVTRIRYMLQDRAMTRIEVALSETYADANLNQKASAPHEDEQDLEGNRNQETVSEDNEPNRQADHTGRNEIDVDMLSLRVGQLKGREAKLRLEPAQLDKPMRGLAWRSCSGTR